MCFPEGNSHSIRLSALGHKPSRWSKSSARTVASHDRSLVVTGRYPRNQEEIEVVMQKAYTAVPVSGVAPTYI